MIFTFYKKVSVNYIPYNRTIFSLNDKTACILHIQNPLYTHTRNMMKYEICAVSIQ